MSKLLASSLISCLDPQATADVMMFSIEVLKLSFRSYTEKVEPSY